MVSLTFVSTLSELPTTGFGSVLQSLDLRFDPFEFLLEPSEFSFEGDGFVFSPAGFSFGFLLASPSPCFPSWIF